MKKLLFYLAALPIVSSAIAISAGGDYIDIHIDGGNKIIFEGIKD